MLNIIILDDTSIESIYYKKIFRNRNRIKKLYLVRNARDLEIRLSTTRIDLIALNLTVISLVDIRRIKQLASLKNIPILSIFRSCDYEVDNKVDLTLRKLDIIEKYMDIKMKGSYKNNLVAIGSSTGGPKALQEIIPKLPSDINATILIVQHMPPNFTRSLAERLDILSAVDVKEAEDGEVLRTGNVYIAPGDFHMLVREKAGKLYIELNKNEKHKGLRPAVDLLMESIAQVERHDKYGIILTGMGNDGAQGIEYLKNKGSYNIAQDEFSSVIYGMPRAAIETGFIDEIIPLNQIAYNILLKVGCNNGFRY